jgi:hypothetical protein
MVRVLTTPFELFADMRRKNRGRRADAADFPAAVEIVRTVQCHVLWRFSLQEA